MSVVDLDDFVTDSLPRNTKAAIITLVLRDRRAASSSRALLQVRAGDRVGSHGAGSLLWSKRVWLLDVDHFRATLDQAQLWARERFERVYLR